MKVCTRLASIGVLIVATSMLAEHSAAADDVTTDTNQDPVCWSKSTRAPTSCKDPDAVASLGDAVQPNDAALQESRATDVRRDLFAAVESVLNCEAERKRRGSPTPASCYRSPTKRADCSKPSNSKDAVRVPLFVPVCDETLPTCKETQRRAIVAQCEAHELQMSRLDRAGAEAKRLLTGKKGKWWRSLVGKDGSRFKRIAANIKANIAKYGYDRTKWPREPYDGRIDDRSFLGSVDGMSVDLLEEKLLAEDGKWVDDELARRAKEPEVDPLREFRQHDATPRATEQPATNTASDSQQ